MLHTDVSIGDWRASGLGSVESISEFKGIIKMSESDAANISGNRGKRLY